MATLGYHGEGLCIQDRDSSILASGVWVWVAAWTTQGQKLLTENMEEEWVTAAGTHWVPGFTLIGSCIIPCDMEQSESPVVLGQLQPGAVLEALTVDHPQVGCVLSLRSTC